MESFDKLIREFSKVDIYIKLGLTSVSTLLSIIVVHYLSKWISKRYSEFWISPLASSLQNLGIFSVALYGLIEVILVLGKPIPELISTVTVGQIKSLMFALIGILATLKFKHHFLDNLDKKTANNDAVDSSLIFAADKLLSIVICIFGLLVTLDSLGVPINTLLAFGGIGGVAISWASKDVIANFFGGLMIFLNRPFVNGDWIASPNKNFEGIVEQIGWYRTQIRTFERRPAYIPNSLITDAIVQNPGRMYNRRIKEDIGLRYEDIKIVKKVVEDIRLLLRGHKDIDQGQVMMVHFLSYGAYSVDINIYCFTKTKNWEEYRNVQQDVLLSIAQIVSDNGADFAFPTSTIHTPDLLGGRDSHVDFASNRLV